MKERKILVIGETCVDVFVYGHVKRLAPEAPAPVLVPKESNQCLGMAGNVKNNLIRLGVGCDIITNKNYESIKKTRYIDYRTNTLFLRVDVGEDQISAIKEVDDVTLKKYDIIVISDYCKGLVSKDTIQKISKAHPRVFLDTKKILGNWCSDVYVIKINSDEFDRSSEEILESNFLEEKIICTHGSSGCSYKGKVYKVPRVEIKDLSGAGDAFLAGLAAKYLETQSIKASIPYANKCATLAVQKRGVFLDTIENHD